MTESETGAESRQEISPEDYEVRLTEKAAQVVREAFEAENVEQKNSYLRVGAKPGGCSGYKFDMDFSDASQVTDQDRVFTSNGIQIVVDAQCLTDILGPIEIDYQSGAMMEQGFRFRQLSDGALCGCGESFTPVKERLGS